MSPRALTYSTPLASSPIISKTPVRLSFGGGGTDLEAYYARFGGLVVSATIDKYFCCVVSFRKDRKLVISSDDYGLTEECSDIEALDTEGVFGLVKAVVKSFKPREGAHIHTASDIPTGSGLGLSGAATVGTIKSISSMLGHKLSAGVIAELASAIEIDEMGRPIGKQDQFASAFGGLNEIRFEAGETVVTPLAIDAKGLRELARWTMLFFTGKSRDSASILSEQKGKTEDRHQATVTYLHEIKQYAERMMPALLSGDFVRLGELVDLSWQAKRQIVSSISSHRIEALYDAARRNGALGGKVTGAGGGGFLMLICPPKKTAAVQVALRELDARRLMFRFVSRGTHLAS